ncbi:MAG: selenium cofactor biosynthesis protein YqeC [Chloroflexota bacterium]
MTSPDWSLPAALGIDQPGELVALVGGGGKSSLLFALADALSGRVVMTTTTRMSAAQVASAPAVCMADDLSRLSGYLDEHGRCLVIGSIKGEKALGVDVDLPGQLLARPDVDYVLVEADGARMRPIKAPAEHEPAIPRKRRY